METIDVEAEVRSNGERTSLARRDEAQPMIKTEMDVQDVIHQVTKVQQCLSNVMQEDTHYGVIPGTNQKKTLLQPGAEKLILMFRLDPRFQVEKEWDGDHLTATVTCVLYHIPTGDRLASGIGMCSTKESKYRWRTSRGKCPKCGSEEAVRKTKRGHWCIPDRGGCGYNPTEAEMDSQPKGRVEHPDIADTYNTVLKMAAKRAKVAAVINATAASDIFTQDIGDPEEVEAAPPPPRREPDPPPPRESRKAVGAEKSERSLDAVMQELLAFLMDHKDHKAALAKHAFGITLAEDGSGMNQAMSDLSASGDVDRAETVLKDAKAYIANLKGSK